MSKNSFYKKMIISVASAALLSVGVTESTTATNNVSATTVKSAKKVVAKTKVVGATSAVYKKAGKKVVKTKQTISAGKKVKTYGKKTIAGVAYYSIGKDQYVKAANLDGKTRQLAKSVALYARSGKVIKNSKLRKGQSVKVYGTAVTIKGKKYYSTGKGYVAVKALAKKVAEEVPNNKTNTPATDTNKPADNNKPAENTNNPSSNNTNTNNSSSNNSGSSSNEASLKALKDAASAAIDDAAAAANAQIDNSTLPTVDKDKAKAHIAKAVTSAKKIINDEQTKSADIVKITNSWISTIKQFVPTDTLKDAKLLAAKAIDEAAKAAKTNISNSILSSEDKAKMQAHVDNIATDAKKAINDATSLEMIAKTQSDWTNNINTAAPKNIKWQDSDLTLINGVLKIKGSATPIKDPATILSALNTANIDPDEVTSISIEGNLKLSGKVDELFSSLHKLQKIDGLSLLDISEATSIQSMFYGCKDLKELDLSSFNTNKVTDMHSMFKKCFNLSKITFGKDFSTKLVTDMHGMFGDCSVLTGLDLNGFDTSNVTDMREMFAGDKQLTKLDLSKFNTDKVTDMYDMFYCCYGLTDLDLSNFNIGSTTNTEGMFKGDTALVNIKISSKLLDALHTIVKDNGLDINKLHLDVLPIVSTNK
ncbi:BspA family leucine-rich repeat surface protein [Lactobacillus sp. ESL0230]|uniref:BspA family leucine-rich repeat surface protein n=1 Tax=Lactobacillus sp. ESL0230 TaxID=2069353 RepID=UPI000EFB2DB4|nr:BspA family leucine-rich repeat surface protein [Lactobacillus sp. ESL0230]RMC46192.1 BspA family leucine-rich repeat surface protein [Lactobacillus sp. ESL0230]